MVNTSSNSKKENNRVVISNNKAKYYSDLAQTYANQSKTYSEIAQDAQEAINTIVNAEDLSTIADNINDIQEIAENLDSLTAATAWGDIEGTLSSQVDLKGALDAKADTADLSKVATTGSYNDLSDKPEIPDISNLATKTELNAKADTSDLADVATSGSYDDLTNKPTIPSQYTLPTASTTTLGGVKIDGTSITISDGVISSQNMITSYNDLTNKPKINNIVIAGNQSLDKLGIQPAGDYVEKSGLSAVASSGSYNDLSDKPSIPSQYTLPTASTTTLGGVKVDGSSITISDGVISASVSEGTMDYSDLTNKPKINNVELSGNKTLSDLGIQPAGNYLTSIPAEYVTETELNNKNYLTDSDLTGYALKSEIPTVPQNITTQGNSFNSANQLVKLDASGKLPAIDGSQLTNISSAGSTTSTLPDAITHSNGQFTVELGKNYAGKVNSTSITVIIDKPTDYSKIPYPYSTLIQLWVPSDDATITFKTSEGAKISRYFNDTTPDISKAGSYDIVIEQYGTDQDMSFGDITTGVIYTGPEDLGGSSGGGIDW